MTHRKTFPAVSFVGIVTAAMIAGAPAMAQTDTTGSTASGAETRPDQITCAQLTQMDTAVVPGTLYFVAGYDRGTSDSMNLSDPTGTATDLSTTTGTDTATSTTGTDSTSTTGTTTDLSTATGTDTATSTTGTDTTSATGTDTTASTTGTETASTTGTTGSDTGATPQVGRLSGFFEIPVETIVTACADAPERSVSDVVEEQRGMSGTQAN